MAANHNGEDASVDKDRVIPIRRVPLTDQSQLPANYSATPGGTLFSTTPGGTRIIYDREFLLQCRNSPHAKSPPVNLPNIPGVTHPVNNIAQRENLSESGDNLKKIPEGNEDPQFHMDM